MEDYYRKWASDYEKFYYTCSSEIKEANIFTSEILQKFLKGKSVLEIACGTGYWTKILSHVALEIIAIDILPEVLKFARIKEYQCSVFFVIADAYNLPIFTQQFDGGLANFWFSHIPKTKIDSFLLGFHKALLPGSTVIISDNNPQHLPDGKLVTFPGDENTYRLCTVKDGSEHYILKNYFSKEDLISIFGNHISNFDESNIYYDEYIWRVVYEI